MIKKTHVIIVCLVIAGLVGGYFVYAYTGNNEKPWTYVGHDNRIKITVPDAIISGAQTNFVLYLETSNAGIMGDIETAAFTTLEGEKLAFEKVYKTTAAETPDYWVKLPVLSESNNEFYMYIDGLTTTSPSNPWSGYTGVWHFEEQTTNYLDSSPNNIDSDDMALSGRNEGYIGAGPKFTGQNFIEFEFDEAMRHKDLNIEFWIRDDNVYAEYGILSLEPRESDSGQTYNEFCPNHGWNLEIGWNKRDILIQNGEYGRNITSSNDNIFENNTWYHVSINYHDGGLVHYYINGDEIETYGTGSYGLDYFSGWNWPDWIDPTLRVGWNGFPITFFGNIDELRISSHPKDESWAETNYLNQRGNIPLDYGEIEVRQQ